MARLNAMESKHLVPCCYPVCHHVVTSVLNPAGLTLSLAETQYQCLPTGVKTGTRGPAGNDMTIAQNIGVLAGILVGLRLFTFLLLQAAYKLKKL